MTLIIFLCIFYWITKARKVITLHSRKWCKASTVTEAPSSREKNLLVVPQEGYIRELVSERPLYTAVHRAGFHCGSREEAIEFNCCAHSLASANKTRFFIAANSLGARMLECSLRLNAAKLISFLGR